LLAATTLRGRQETIKTRKDAQYCLKPLENAFDNHETMQCRSAPRQTHNTVF
jgi:hypothetical protein